MGVNAKKLEQLDAVWEHVTKLKNLITATLGDGMMLTEREDGSEEDPTALVFMDLPSFMSFNQAEKKIFEMALAKSDAVNFFSLPNEWIRITFAVLNEYDREYTGTEKTEVLQLHKKKE